MATVKSGAGFALNMDTLNLGAKISSYNRVDSHADGGTVPTGEAIRFWYDDGIADASELEADGVTPEATPDYLQNYTRLVGAGLTSDAGTINRIVTVTNEAEELSIGRFSMSLGSFRGYVAAPAGTEAFLKVALTGNDSVAGGNLADILRGFTGNDDLTGGAGADTFVFETALNKSTNVDRITDFSAEDTLRLDDAVFTKLSGFATLAVGALANWDARDEADDRIIYRHVDSNDADTLKDMVNLYYDPTGGSTSDAVLFGQLTNQATVNLTADDFRIA